MGTMKATKITVTLDELRELGLDEEQINVLILADKKRDEMEDIKEGSNEDQQAEMQSAEEYASGGSV